jgi:hypothetical protein
LLELERASSSPDVRRAREKRKTRQETEMSRRRDTEQREDKRRGKERRGEERKEKRRGQRKRGVTEPHVDLPCLVQQ